MASPTNIVTNIQGLSNLTQATVDVSGRLQTGSYWSQLRPASWRGMPFGVFEGTAHFGRRNAVHEYPFRDTPWVEDMGRMARKFTVMGFIVGDDAIAQRDRFLKEVERAIDGELVHPTLGTRLVALLDFTCTETWERGRVFEIQLTCMEQGQRIFPQQVANGKSAVANAATETSTCAVAAFIENTLTALSTSAKAANDAAQHAALWAGLALQVSRDATSLLNLGAILPGEFGRLVGQASSLKIGQVVQPLRDATQATLKGISASSRTVVSSAVDALNTAGSSLGVGSAGTFADAAQSLAESIRTSASTPADAIRSLVTLSSYSPTQTSSGVSGAVLGETSVLLQRASAVSMTRAASEFQPASEDDAVNVRTTVLTAIDTAITAAGDRGDDPVYAQLRTLRAATVADLNLRGAGLPSRITVTTPTPVPALTLAYRLYGTVTRADDLVKRGRPIHPAFMPTSFQALSA